MYPLAIVALFSAIIMSCYLQMTHQMEMISQHRAALDARYVAIASEAFQWRLQRTGSLGTTTLANLQSDQTGFKAQSVDPARVFIVGAAGVDDGSWQFDRVLVYAADKDNQHLTEPAVISAASVNRCDTSKGLATALTWCGPTSGITYNLIETRQIYKAWLTEEVMRMEATLHKMARGYKSKFPRGSVSAGGNANMCALGTAAVGASGCSQLQCTGVRNIDGAPLDCSDLLTVWGNPAVLNYINSKHIALVSSAANVRVATTGATRKIARELRVP